MPILLTNTKDTSGPTYRRVAESLRLLIVSGAIPRGSKLPSSRNLAEFNQIHRQTIMNAFGELMAQGYILAEERKAYYVARELPEDLQTGTSLTTLHNPTPYPWQWNQTANTQPRKRLVDLSSVRPDLDLLPWNELRSCYRRALQSRHENHMQYGNPQGLDIFIQTYQAYLQQSRRIFGRDIVVTNGSQEGIYLALKLPIKPGDIVAMAQLCYPNASQIVSPLGGKVRGVNMDTQGLCPEHLEMICRKHSVRALYLTPLHQYPTTITLSAKRRQMIYEVCRKYQVAIIEDDYDHEFHFDTKPQAPMASGDVDLRIIYLSTLSKTIFPGLRLGVIAAPPNISERLARLKDQLSGETNAVGQLAVAYWMQTEGFERYLRTMRRRYQGKRDMVHNLLQQANHKQKRSFFSYNLPLGGLAFWISIPTPIETLQSHCEDKGYTLRDTNFYAIDKLPNNSFRLSYAGLDESGLEQGIKVLTDLAKKQMV